MKTRKNNEVEFASSYFEVNIIVLLFVKWIPLMYVLTCAWKKKKVKEQNI